MEVEVEVPEDFDEADPIFLANFSNGRLVASSNPRDEIDITVYKKKGDSRRARRKMMVAQTDHMTYVGTNYETEAGLTGPLPCRYIIGALNPVTKKMTLHRTEIFHMRPFVPGRTDLDTLDAPQDELDFSDRFHSMVSSFGSEKAKRALSSARRNKIDAAALEMAISPAVSHMEKLAQADSEGTVATAMMTSVILPCNRDATTPEEVYNLDDVISAIEMQQLIVPAKTLSLATEDDILKWRDASRYSRFVLAHLPIPASHTRDREKQAAMLLYCHYLISVHNLNAKTVRNQGLSSLQEIPSSIRSSLTGKFLSKHSDGRSTDGGQHHDVSMPRRGKDKLLSHLLVLCLMLDNFTLNGSLLQQDLKLQTNRLQEHLHALGCTISTSTITPGSKNRSITANLKIPLRFPKPRSSTRRSGQK